MDNTSPNSATIPVLRWVLRRYDIQNKDFILIFIHDLQSWSVSKLWEFLSKRISSCNEIVHGITKKHTTNMENYFILRLNYDKPTYYLNILFLLTRCLPIYKIIWILLNINISFLSTLRLFKELKCIIGKIYVPTVTHKEERKNVFSEITN